MIRRHALAVTLAAPGLLRPAAAQSYDLFFRALDVDNAAQVAALLAQGFDPNTPDERGHRPLYLALQKGNFTLLQAVANIFFGFEGTFEGAE